MWNTKIGQLRWGGGGRWSWAVLELVYRWKNVFGIRLFSYKIVRVKTLSQGFVANHIFKENIVSCDRVLLTSSISNTFKMQQNCHFVQDKVIS